MSDFSAGILMHEKHREIAKVHLEKHTHLIELNDMWFCRLSENDFCEMAVESYSEAVLAMSEQIPLLHVISAEDHEFELGILHHKKIVFHVRMPYDVVGNFAFDIVTELYGDECMEIIMNPDCAVQEKIKNEIQRRHHEVEEMVQSLFLEITEEGIEQFSQFGFDSDACAKIKDILTAENYQRDDMGYQMMKELFAVLKLSEFSFVSHKYVDLKNDIYNIVK